MNDGDKTKEQLMSEIEEVRQQVAYWEHQKQSISRLRDKLNDSPPQIILSQLGEGYKFISPM
ncbi:MAG: hypothetical protein ACETVW_02410 [Dehalococcoidia bacterium]